MAVIQKEIELAGSKGKIREVALFDSGSTYSLIVKSVAKKIAHILPSAEIVEFKTAKPKEKIKSKEVVQLFFWVNGYRFSDEFFVIEKLTEKIIIGAATLQKWRLKLDFEHEDIIIDPKVTKLRLI
jgi:tryptophan 2,3-dioxygenase